MNQRLEFDLDGFGRRMFVSSGSSDGVVKVYDVSSGTLEDTLMLYEVVMSNAMMP